MSWWEYVITAAVLIAGIYAFVALTRYVTGFLSQGSSRTADTMYDNYADSPRKQRRYAGRHGGEWEGRRGHPLSRRGRHPPARARQGCCSPPGPASQASRVTIGTRVPFPCILSVSHLCCT